MLRQETQSNDVAAITANADRAGAGDPSEIAIPGITDPAGLRGFLETSGKPLVDLVDVTADLAADPTPTEPECQDVADTLRSMATPEELMDLAVQIDDQPTGDIAQNFVAATHRALASCGTGDDAAVPELAFEWMLWRARVDAATK